MRKYAALRRAASLSSPPVPLHGKERWDSHLARIASVVQLEQRQQPPGGWTIGMARAAGGSAAHRELRHRECERVLLPVHNPHNAASSRSSPSLTGDSQAPARFPQRVLGQLRMANRSLDLALHGTECNLWVGNERPGISCKCGDDHQRRGVELGGAARDMQRLHQCATDGATSAARCHRSARR